MQGERVIGLPAEKTAYEQEPDRIEIQRQCIHEISGHENQTTQKKWGFVREIGPPAIHKCRYKCSQWHGSNNHPTQ